MSERSAPDDAPIAFKGQLTEEDWRLVNRLVARRSSRWVLAFALVVVLLVAMPLWTWGSLTTRPDLFLVRAAPLLALFVIWALMLALLPRFVTRYHWRRNKILQQPVRGTVSQAGIDITVENISTVHLPWELLLKYREGKDLLLVYQGPNQVMYFFRKYFATEADWQAVRALVARKLPAK